MAKQRQLQLGLTYGRHCAQTFEVSSFRGDNNHTHEVGYSAWISKIFNIILYQSLLKKLRSQEVREQILQRINILTGIENEG